MEETRFFSEFKENIKREIVKLEVKKAHLHMQHSFFQ